MVSDGVKETILPCRSALIVAANYLTTLASIPHAEALRRDLNENAFHQSIEAPRKKKV